MSYFAQQDPPTSFASLLETAQQGQFDPLPPQQQQQQLQQLQQQVSLQQGGYGGSTGAAGALGAQGALGGNSLPSSGSSYQSLALSSPQSSLSSLYSTHRARFMSSKGFELEDDIEFCPEIQLKQPPVEGGYYATPQSSPLQHFAREREGASGGSSAAMAAAPPHHSPSTPRTHTPRVRKALEIVNPHTGMRIDSTKLSPPTK